MALPTINDVQMVEPVLTNMMTAFRQGTERFIASRVFPVVNVATDSGTFYKFTKKYWYLDALQRRAPGDPFARLDFGVESDTYKTEQWAADYAIPDEVRANASAPLDLERAAVDFLGQKSMLRKEIQFAADFMKTGVWGTDNTSATDWDDFTWLFFHNTQNTYMHGLDPTYMYEYNPDLYWLWRSITRGEVENPGQIIYNTFGASYVITDLNHDRFLGMARADPTMREVYRDDYAAIFVVTGAVG